MELDETFTEAFETIMEMDETITELYETAMELYERLWKCYICTPAVNYSTVGTSIVSIPSFISIPH